MAVENCCYIILRPITKTRGEKAKCYIQQGLGCTCFLESYGAELGLEMKAPDKTRILAIPLDIILSNKSWNAFNHGSCEKKICLILFLFLMSISIIAVLLTLLTAPVPLECSSYTTLNTADRAAKSTGNMNKCDRNDLSSIPKWYRFSGAAGTMMPTSPVPVRYCGTHAPGWLNGKHPSKNEGAVSRKVCFHWSNNVCRWNIQITVRNCGSFYVYKLPRTPNCSLRYCGTSGQCKCFFSVF